MKVAAGLTNQAKPLKDGAVVALLLMAATAGAFLVDHHVSLTSQAMLYVLAVVLASYTLPWLPSVLCAVAAVAVLNFLFVPPRWTFEVDSRENLIALFTMLAVSLVISHLAAALRRETGTARRNEQRARQLQALATGLSGINTPEEVMALGRSALDTAFDGPCFLALRQPGGELEFSASLEPGMSRVSDGMHHCMREAAVLGPGTGRWPGLNAWFLPLGDKDQMNGAACIQNVSASDTDGREHAQALCALLAQALWRMKLTSSMLEAQKIAERQQVQSTFLAAISHDLRTPLSAVVGAASALQLQRDKLSDSEQERLLASIVSEASYLSNVTENTLQLVQLANLSQPLKRDWESMEEIIGSVLTRLRRQDPTRRIKSTVPAGLPLLKADPVLLAQLLSNLLDNALKYSGDAIDLVVSCDGTAMQIAVEDRGAAIPEQDYESIFQPYSRSDQSGQRGAGLGLALCRAIAGAHGGTLVPRRRAGGGNSFTLTLPVDAQQPDSGQP